MHTKMKFLGQDFQMLEQPEQYRQTHRRDRTHYRTAYAGDNLFQLYICTNSQRAHTFTTRETFARDKISAHIDY